MARRGCARGSGASQRRSSPSCSSARRAPGVNAQKVERLSAVMDELGYDARTGKDLADADDRGGQLRLSRARDEASGDLSFRPRIVVRLYGQQGRSARMHGRADTSAVFASLLAKVTRVFRSAAEPYLVTATSGTGPGRPSAASVRPSDSSRVVRVDHRLERRGGAVVEVGRVLPEARAAARCGTSWSRCATRSSARRPARAR